MSGDQIAPEWASLTVRSAGRPVLQVDADLLAPVDLSVAPELPDGGKTITIVLRTENFAIRRLPR